MPDNSSIVSLDPRAVINEAIDQKAQDIRWNDFLDKQADFFNIVRDAIEKFDSNSEKLGAVSTLLADEIKTFSDSKNGFEKRDEALHKAFDIIDSDALSSLFQSGAIDQAADEARRNAEHARIQEEKRREKDREDRRKRDREILDDKYFKAQSDFVAKFESSISDQANTALSVVDSIYSGNYGNAISGVSDLLGRVGEGEIESTGLAAVLESMGMTGAAEVTSYISAGLGGPAMAALMGSISSTDAIFDRIAQARFAAMQQGLTGIDALTLGPGMALQDNLASFASGIDTRTIQSVRETLFKNQAEWGSEEYNQGFDFAMQAQQRYGVGADVAAQYYVNQVIKGGESMNELNYQMETLQMTVENTSIGMEQMQQVIKNNTSTIAGAIGGDQLAAQNMALDMQQYYTEGTGRESQIMAGMIGNVNFATDPLAYQKMQEYIGQGYDETQAMMLVGMDYVSEGRVRGTYGGINYFTTPLDEGRGSLKEYLDNRDWSGLEAALTDFWDGNALNPAMTYFGLRAALKAQFGFTDQDVESPETITNAFRGVVEGVDMAEQGESGNINEAVRRDREGGRVLTDFSHIGTSYDTTNSLNRLMTGRDEIEFDEYGHIGSTGTALARLMYDAGVDFGEDGVTETELESMADQLRQVYIESGSEDDFSTWLTTDEGKERAQHIADQLANSSGYDASEERQRVTVEISLRDDLSQLFLVNVRGALDMIARDDGGQSGDI